MYVAEREYRFVGRKKYDETTDVEYYIGPRGINVLFFRDRRTGRFVPRKPICREIWAIYVIPIHDVYYSSISTLYGSEDLIRKYSDEHYDKFIKWTEKHVKYDEEKWWFKYEPVPRSYECFERIKSSDVKDIFEEINNYHFYWEKEGVPIDQKVEATGYEKE